MLDVDVEDESARAVLAGVGRCFDARGWVPATGGNFSVRLTDGSVVLTASGTHKGDLAADDFVQVDAAGSRCCGVGNPSYETQLHLAVYRRLPQVRAVLHVHSVAGTVLSRRHKTVSLCGYELLKVLPGTPGPAQWCGIPVFDNDQDIARLAGRLEARLRAEPLLAAFLIAGHGLYAWGTTVAEARHRVEALEFMFECEVIEERMGHE